MAYMHLALITRNEINLCREIDVTTRPVTKVFPGRDGSAYWLF